MKKALDQTIRDLKRGVNKKVLKVPGIEQKVLDATSNEPWGPHGSHLADIAQATRNYHEYQLIMVVIWKRINDTGKNWRHVYKALTILEYLVAHGSERVIDDIKEHAYQISTLSDFQYIDSSGRDQGSNVRKKSQSLVALVNDKERISEARSKAVANRDKFRNASSTGGMYRPGSYSSAGDDDRYGNRDDDRNGYGRERDYRDDDRYGRDGDRYGRDSDDNYGRDGYRDGDYRGRSPTVDDYHYGSRSRSSEGYRERGFDDDRYSSRSSGARAEDHSQDERKLERKFSEQNIGAPPPYEEVVSGPRSPVHNERDAEAPAPTASSPTGSASQGPVTDAVSTAASPANQEVDGFDEFDPRGLVSAIPPTASNGEMDLLGSLSESFSSNALALMPATSGMSDADAPINTGSGTTFVALSSASNVLNQSIEDPFGDSPFKAISTTDHVPAQTQNNAAQDNFQSISSGQSSEPGHVPPLVVETNFNFGDTFSGITYAPSNVQAPSTSSQFFPQEQPFANQDTDVLANILPQSGLAAPVASHITFSSSTGPQHSLGSFSPQQGPGALQAPTIPPPRPNTDGLGNFVSQTGSMTAIVPHDSFTAPTGVSSNAQVQKKFEPKSRVWADTLSRGLVNLNISGPKTNPLADIGVDFESINRKEKREKPAAATPVTSTITMGKAMGSGSGIGRVGASGLAPPNTMMNLGMGMGMGMGGGAGMNMGNYGGVMNQPSTGMGMGIGNMGGMGMNMGGIGQVGQMRPPAGVPPAPNMPGNYNPMMGNQGGYPPQPYGGYR